MGRQGMSTLHYDQKNKGINFENIVNLDDSALYSIILKWTKHGDRVLSDLARRIINRYLLKGIDVQHMLKQQ